MKRHVYIYHEIIDKFNGNTVPIVPLSEFLETLGKNGSHLVAVESDLPTPTGVLPKPPVVPNTLLGIRNLYCRGDTVRLGRAVGRLLISGYVTNEQSLILLQRLTQLAQEYDRLHQALLGIPVDELRRVDEEVDGKK